MICHRGRSPSCRASSHVLLPVIYILGPKYKDVVEELPREDVEIMAQRKRCRHIRQTEFGPAQCVYQAEPGEEYCKGHLGIRAGIVTEEELDKTCEINNTVLCR
jgi:hypothetical protein